MSTIRTGDLAQFTRQMGNMREVQHRLHTANEHVATGKAVHRYADLGAASGKLVRTETALREAEMFAEQNEQLGQELNLMDGALATIADVATSFRQAVIARRNDASGSASNLGLEAQGMIDTVVNALNLRVDGRYVFAGSATDGAPVDASLLSDDPSDDSYYQGDQLALRARIDVDAEITYGVLADDQGFAKLLAGLELAIKGHQDDEDAKLQKAAQLADEALDGVVAKRSELATATARIEGVRASQEGTALYLEETVGALTDTDVPATMARIAQDQVALEASYSVMSRLSQLSLTDYLR
jgi:flagellar hook-associated protein 3 FlgL